MNTVFIIEVTIQFTRDLKTACYCFLSDAAITLCNTQVIFPGFFFPDSFWKPYNMNQES